jgi:NTP pyrophosphatase (non-canonical NTP hydrolase)
MKDVDAYAQWVEDMWFSGDTVPEGAPTDFMELRNLFIMSMGLPGEVGEVCEKIKKYVRDGTLDKDALKKELGDALYYLNRICKFFNFEPSDVINANVEKIESRHERGTMRGSGDNR